MPIVPTVAIASEFLDAFALKLSRYFVCQDAGRQALSLVSTALPPCIAKRNLETMPERLAPEDVEGLDLEDLAHPDVA